MKLAQSRVHWETQLPSYSLSRVPWRRGRLCFLESLGPEPLPLLNPLNLEMILLCPQIRSLFHAMAHIVGTYTMVTDFNEDFGHERGYASHKHFEFNINVFPFFSVLLPSWRREFLTEKKHFPLGSKSLAILLFPPSMFPGLAHCLPRPQSCVSLQTVTTPQWSHGSFMNKDSPLQDRNSIEIWGKRLEIHIYN